MSFLTDQDRSLLKLEVALGLHLGDYFSALDELRESGRVNMFSSASVLENSYPLDRKLARAISHAWMDSFDGNLDPNERADRILA